MDFHIWNLPPDRVYVKFEKEFQRSLFLKSKAQYGSWPKLAQELNCNNRSVMNWAYSKNFMTLHTAFIIATMVDTKFEDLERNLVAIATGKKTKVNGKRGTPVYNPKFPIKLTPQLARILARFMGDGCIKTNWYYESVYFNKESNLIDAMIDDIKNVFGNIKTSINIDDGVKCVRFPNIIGLTVVTMFGNVDTFKARVPEVIINGNDEIKTAFLQAYFDDEGTVDKTQPMARYYTTNLQTSTALSEMLLSLGIKAGNGKTRYLARNNKKNIIYHVNITGTDNLNKFFLKINPLHQRKHETLLAHSDTSNKL